MCMLFIASLCGWIKTINNTVNSDCGIIVYSRKTYIEYWLRIATLQDEKWAKKRLRMVYYYVDYIQN